MAKTPNKDLTFLIVLHNYMLSTVPYENRLLHYSKEKEICSDPKLYIKKKKKNQKKKKKKKKKEKRKKKNSSRQPRPWRLLHGKQSAVYAHVPRTWIQYIHSRRLYLTAKGQFTLWWQR